MLTQTSSVTACCKHKSDDERQQHQDLEHARAIDLRLWHIQVMHFDQQALKQANESSSNVNQKERGGLGMRTQQVGIVPSRSRQCPNMSVSVGAYFLLLSSGTTGCRLEASIQIVISGHVPGTAFVLQMLQISDIVILQGHQWGHAILTFKDSCWAAHSRLALSQVTRGLTCNMHCRVIGATLPGPSYHLAAMLPGLARQIWT